MHRTVEPLANHYLWCFRGFIALCPPKLVLTPLVSQLPNGVMIRDIVLVVAGFVCGAANIAAGATN